MTDPIHINALTAAVAASQLEKSSIGPNLKVAAVIDANRLVVNAGSDQGLKKGQQFVVYAIGDEISDPDTGESLGRLEIMKGRGIITHVQEKISTLESITRQPNNGSFFNALAVAAGVGSSSTEIRPFIKAERGDLLRRDT